MSTDDIKKKEQTAYNRGYVAGRKRVKRDNATSRQYHEERAFKDKVFLAMLPTAVSLKIAMEGKTDQHVREVEAAWWFAGEALKQRRIKNS